ncbi:MAG: chemotaxis protein CheA [Rhodothermales bacterium]
MAENNPKSDVSPSIEDRFAEEALNTLTHAREVLTRLAGGVSTTDAYDDVARAVFTLNGAAEVLDLEQIKVLTASFCNAVTSIRDAGISLSESAANTLQNALDALVDLIERMRTGNEQSPFITPLIAELDLLSANPGTPAAPQATAEPAAPAAPEAVTEPVAAATTAPEVETPAPAEAEAEAEATPAAEVEIAPAAETEAAPPAAAVEVAPAAETEIAPAAEVEIAPADEAPAAAPKRSYAPSASMLADANAQMELGDMQMVIDAFVEDATPSIEDLKQDVFGLNGGENDASLLQTMLKVVGNLRSTAGFLSLEQLSLLSRKLEHVAHQMLSGHLDWSTVITDTFSSALEHLQTLVQQVADRKIVAVDQDELLATLDAWIPEDSKPPALTVVETAPAPVAATPQPAAPAPEEEEEKELEDVLVDETHQIHSEDFREIVESFVVEATEILDNLDNKLLSLEDHIHDRALVDEIFRDVHTVKGSAGFLNLQQLSHIAHHFEDVLNRLRRGDIEFHPAMMDVMFAAYDQMKVLALQVKNLKLEVVKQGHLIKQLTAISSGTFKPDAAASIRRDAAIEPEPTAGDDEAHEAPDSGAARTEAGGDARGAASASRGLDRSTETIRVEVHRLDNLMNLVGELVLNRNRLVQITEDLNSSLSDDLQRGLLETSAQLDFITTELQTGVMHTRMVQIGRIFNKFPRVVRDLARSTNKEIELVIEGAETELDKSLTEEIGDPLVHLLRNSVDHGVEVPEQRLAAGKPAVGTIRLVARQEGNNIIIEVSDDGAGINVDRVKRKAIEKGLITEAEATEMTDDEAFNLIFKPGFSTAEKISNISGRGVGMDVVKTHIARLNGTIGISSEMGKGSSVTLKLPLTLAIKQSLLVRQSKETFAIPLHSVIEVVGLENHKIDSINGREVLRLRERILPLVYISDILGLEKRPDFSAAYAVIVGLAHHRVGLITEDLVGQKEIVIKPLGNYLKKIPGIAGSTILGDGRVIMILDVAELIRLEQEHPRRRPETGSKTEKP